MAWSCSANSTKPRPRDLAGVRPPGGPSSIKILACLTFGCAVVAWVFTCGHNFTLHFTSVFHQRSFILPIQSVCPSALAMQFTVPVNSGLSPLEANQSAFSSGHGHMPIVDAPCFLAVNCGGGCAPVQSAHCQGPTSHRPSCDDRRSHPLPLQKIVASEHDNTQIS